MYHYYTSLIIAVVAVIQEDKTEVSQGCIAKSQFFPIETPHSLKLAQAPALNAKLHISTLCLCKASLLCRREKSLNIADQDGSLLYLRLQLLPCGHLEFRGGRILYEPQSKKVARKLARSKVLEMRLIISVAFRLREFIWGSGQMETGMQHKICSRACLQHSQHLAPWHMP